MEEAKYNASLYCRRENRTVGVTYGGVDGPRKRGLATRKGKLTVLVHGDDFVASGAREDIA